MFRQDFIERAIEDLSRAVAALLSKSQPPAAALNEIREAKRLIPLTPGLIDVLPAAAIRERLADAHLTVEVAKLLRLEADALAQLGDEVRAARLMRCSERLLQTPSPSAESARDH